MYKKFLMLFLAFMISGAIFMSCSSDDDGGTTDPTPDPKLTITSPNSGEVIQIGTEIIIRFDNDLTEAVSIDLYKAGEWLENIDRITGVDTLAWTIPSLDIDTDYSIKIESTIDSTIFDFTDVDFTIVNAGQYILVTSSNGGDIWLEGTNELITWYDNIDGTVSIQLYKNNIWIKDLFTNVSSNGSKNWLIPDLDAGADYSIRISSDVPGPSDYSNNFFCISEPNFTGSIIGDWELNFTWLKQPTVINFESDFTWYVDSLTTGTWSMDGNGLHFDFDDLDTYYLGIVEDNEMAGTMVDSDGDLGVWDAERVIPEVLTPNGGQVWMHGTTQTITWDSNIAGNVVLSLADSASTVDDVVQEIVTVPGSDGTYDWTVPASIEPGAAYLIRIAKEINGEAMDESDHYICISNTDVVDILGDWKGNYTWTKGDFTFDFVNDGTFTWVEGGGSPVAGTWENSGNGLRLDFDPWPTTYFIGNVGVDKIIGTFVDGSSTAIWDAQRLLDITYPNGGEIFELGDIVNITWDDNLTSDYVSIDLYENEVLLQSITASTINDNDYPWTIPNDLVLSTKYNIMITSATSDIYDGCDDFFTINGIAPAAIEDENFEDGLAQNWVDFEGVWAVADSIYSCEMDVENNSLAYFDSILTGNYVFEAKMRKISGNWYGLLVNSDHTITTLGNGLCNSMQIIVEVDGSYHFWRANGSSWIEIATGTSPAIVIGLNEWNVFKVIVNNDANDYHLYINGEYITSVHDTTFDQGEIGLYSWDATAGDTTEIDYVKVSQINKSALNNIDIKYNVMKPTPVPVMK